MAYSKELLADVRRVVAWRRPAPQRSGFFSC